MAHTETAVEDDPAVAGIVTRIERLWERRRQDDDAAALLCLRAVATITRRVAPDVGVIELSVDWFDSAHGLSVTGYVDADGAQLPDDARLHDLGDALWRFVTSLVEANERAWAGFLSTAPDQPPGRFRLDVRRVLEEVPDRGSPPETAYSR